MNGFSQFIQRFGVMRLIAVLGASAGVAAVLAAVLMNVGGQPQALLYSDLDLREAGQITQALDQANIPYESRGDGSTIMVSRDRVGSARMMLAGRGLPTQSSVGYELFDKMDDDCRKVVLTPGGPAITLAEQIQAVQAGRPVTATSTSALPGDFAPAI